MESETAAFFADQVSLNSLVQNVVYAFQHGEISLTMQLAGIVVCIGAGVVTALVTAMVLKATIGLRVSDEDMAEGLDSLRWGVETDVVTKEDLPRA